jgi:hypothetical protein
MTNKHKITEIRSFIVDGVHKADLSHNADKSQWFITIKGDFYTEFTFNSQEKAEAMYEILISCTNIYMDSLLTGITKHELIPSKIDIVKATSPEAIEYEEGCNKYKMTDDEIIAYQEGM